MSDDFLNHEEEEERAAEAEQAEQDAAIEAEAAARAARGDTPGTPKSAGPKAVPDAGEEPQDPEAAATDLRDKLLRALAEVENTRRRAERDKEDAYKYAVTRFARDILSVADNLHRALDSVDDAARAEGGEALGALVTGVSMTQRELLNTFEKHGIKQVNPDMGEKFDPNLHQAIAEVPGTGQASGTVVQVTQIGFTIEDRLLRPAMVLIAKGDTATKAPEGAAAETSAETPKETEQPFGPGEGGAGPGSKIDTQA